MAGVYTDKGFIVDPGCSGLVALFRVLLPLTYLPPINDLICPVL